MGALLKEQEKNRYFIWSLEFEKHPDYIITKVRKGLSTITIMTTANLEQRQDGILY